MNVQEGTCLQTLRRGACARPAHGPLLSAHNPIMSAAAARDPSSAAAAAGRKRADGGQPLALGERSNGQAPPNVFQATLADAGFGLGADDAASDASHTLSRDISAFSRCCFKAFNRKEEAVAAFMEGFEEYAGEPENLLKCLKPWVSTREGGAARSFYAQQDTLIKLLLGVDSIQTQLLELLVGKMAEHAEDMGDGEGGGAASDGVPRLCLNQVRWLDRVKDCPKLVGALLEVMQLLQPDMQREIIECFPEIIDDRQHDDVVQSLLEQMDSDQGLLPPVLDALSNLNLESEMMSTVQAKVMPKLKSADLQVLPLLVKFLLQTAGSGPDGVGVISGIRSLDVTALRVGSGDENALQAERASAESLVIESLRGGFRCNFAISHVVLKELEKADRHTAMDVWILLVLHSLPGHRVKVQATCRKKAKKGSLSPEIIRQAVEASASALREYFSDALELAGTLTRDSPPAARRCGSIFYRALFATFEEDFHRQEVLTGLITHTGSSVAREVDCALAVARDLSATEPHAANLRRHLLFVQNIMDYMEAFSDEQIRTLYTIFANLSLSEMRSTGTMPMDDQVHILLRKQLGHPDVVYKRMGILGATAMIACFGLVDASAPAVEGAAAGEGEGLRVSGELFKYVEDMLSMVFKNCKGKPGCLAFAYDELSLSFESTTIKLDDRILSNIFDRISEEFEGGYLLDLGDDAVLVPAPLPDLALKSGAWMNLDQRNAVIVLNVLPLAASAITHEREQLTTLCSLFRLLVTATRRCTGSVEDIDALLGCPLYMFDTSSGGPCDGSASRSQQAASIHQDSIHILDSTFRAFFANLPKREKELATRCVFLTTNWVRELLNGFCTETSDEMKVKTRQRLRDLVSLESLLDICLEIHPAANLPNLNQPLGAMLSEKKEGAGGGRTKKLPPAKKQKISKTVALPKDGTGDDDDDEDGGDRDSIESGGGQTQGAQTTQRSKSDSGSGGGGPRKLSHYNALAKPLMREMLLCSSLMLSHTGDMVRIHENTENQEEEQQVISLVKEARLMHYVLNELLEKVRLITKKDKVSTFGGGGGASASHFPGLCRLDQKSAVTTLMPVLKSLRQHLVDLGAAAQSCQPASPDEDGMQLDDEEPADKVTAQYTAESIVLLVQILHELLKCPELHTVAESRGLLCQVLRAMANYPENIPADFQDPHTFAQAAYDAFTFLEKYASKVSNKCLKNFAVASEFIPLLNQISILASLQVAAADADILDGGSLTLGPKGKLSTRLSRLAGNFMETPWEEAKKLNKENLANMIRIHITEADDPVSEMDSKMQAVIAFQADAKKRKTAGMNEEGDDRGEAMLPTLNSGTLSVYIKTLMEEVPVQLSRVASVHTSDGDNEEELEKLEQLKTIVGFFKGLLMMTRGKVKGNALLRGLIKHGRNVVEIFAKKWLPILEKQFVRHYETISPVLTIFQKGTRQMQIICSHGKASRELGIAGLVPATKKSLETVIYRVKLLLENVGGGYGAAFGQGALKHRELDGREVSSQAEPSSDEDDADEDEDSADDQ